MTIHYKDLFKSVDIDGYNLLDNFDSKSIIITELNKTLEKINIKSTDRLDNLATEYFDDDKLFWLLLIINKTSITNPLAINYNYSELFNSLNKSLILNPIRYIKVDIFDKINTYLSIISNIIKQINNNNIICSSYHKDNYIFTLNEMIKLSNIIAVLKFKNEIEISDEEDNGMYVFKNIVLDYFNNTSIKPIILSILENDLDIYDDTKYTIVNNSLINFSFNINDIKQIKYLLLYTYYWSENIKEK